ncbi:LacI family DNA-binding transcriptional regulator [Pseudonocardia nigra]|uniref:LacI family DNA-binding transcriptional regulator n=1 Tax=Pseudonocardia nigra TaxID=1921578 RepID=UPI001C5D8362|nr:LacI family DNA-binding transcriptional regulator [Pseudonocardia nigra]
MVANDARPTIRTVAERAGVSKSLVSLVLRDSPNVSQAKREAVLRVMDELGYRPNAAARTLAERRTRAIGVLLNDLRQPWFADLLDGLTSVLHARGQRILLGDGRLDRLMDETLTRTFLELGVDGLVLAGTMPISPAIAAIAEEIPTVAVGSRDLDVGRVDTVANDDRLGGRLATEHLIELGHTRIAHISGPTGLVGTLRQAGYEDTMRAQGLVEHIAVEPSDLTEDGGYRAAVRLLSRPVRPTAIVAVNDMACLGARSAATELGIYVPGALSLVGYDNSHLARLRCLWITSVDGAGFEVGRRAAHALLARIADPARPTDLTLITPSLAVRGSTAPPHTG